MKVKSYPNFLSYHSFLSYLNFLLAALSVILLLIGLAFLIESEEAEGNQLPKSNDTLTPTNKTK